jgi:hypothetical protein
MNPGSEATPKGRATSNHEMALMCLDLTGKDYSMEDESKVLAIECALDAKDAERDLLMKAAVEAVPEVLGLLKGILARLESIDESLNS